MRTALLAMLLLPTAQDEARKWIERLGSEDFQERTEAARRLKELGKAAVPALQEAARDADVERSGTARRLLRALEIHGRLTPNLLALFPGLEDRLAADGHAWTDLFLDLTRRDVDGTPAHPTVRVADFDAVVADALRHARPEELLTLCDGHVVGTRSRRAVPVLRELLAKAAPPRLRKLIAVSLGDLGAVEAAPELRGLLKDPDPLVRHAVVRTLARLDDAPSVPRLLELLDDPEQLVRLDVVLALGSLRAKAAGPRILELLSSEHPVERRYAIEGLLELGDADAAGPALIRLLEHADPSTRGSSAWALGGLGHRAALPAIRLLTKDADPGVRSAAAEALGSLGDATSIPDLILLLGDPAEFDGICWRGSTLVIGRTHPATLAIESLGRLGAKDAVPALAKLLKDPDSELAAPAAEWLCSLGSPAGLSLLLDAMDPSVFLNALSRPEEWKKLREARVTERWRGTERELIERAARSAGLEVVWPATLSPDLENSMLCRRELSPWEAPSAAEVLDRTGYDTAYLLEAGRIRVVERHEALRHWTALRK